MWLAALLLALMSVDVPRAPMILPARPPAVEDPTMPKGENRNRHFRRRAAKMERSNAA